MDKEENIVQELLQHRPQLVFLQATIIEGKKNNIISRIKTHEELGSLFLVVFSSKDNGSALAHDLGADFFLPVPFSESQIRAILRNVSSESNLIMFSSAMLLEEHALYDQLSEIGFNIIFADTIEASLSEAIENFPDLILCDQLLLDGPGIQFVQKIKNDPLTAHLPVIFLARDHNDETLEACFEAGIQEIFFQPYESKRNIEIIKSILPNMSKKIKKDLALVVDDNFVIRNLISKMLRKAGFLVTAAENGSVALEIAKREHPDIITCDFQMPVMDGFEFCRLLNEDAETTDIPIVMITGRDTTINRKKSHLLGVKAYLTKPFNNAELVDAVVKAVNESRKIKASSELEKFVSSDARKQIADSVEGRVTDDTEDKFISILFSDIVSFTAMCEWLSPNDVVRLLNMYFNKMVTVLQDNNAIIDKFIGDAIVARFDSGDREVDAMRACRSSIQMLDALKELNPELISPLSIRIGINSGRVVLGRLGCDKVRLDYTMIGDNVNIAQRLESSAAKNTCLISENTYQLGTAHLKVGEAVKLTLKGRSGIYTAYPLQAVASPSSPF